MMIADEKQEGRGQKASVALAFSAATTALGLAYWWRQRHNGTQEQPPGPPGLPLLGNLPRATEHREQALLHLQQHYGDLVRLQIGPRTVFLLSHPDYAKYVLQDNNRNYIKARGLQKARELLGEGLLTNEGEAWREQRRLIQPVFHRRKIEGFATTMTAATEQMLQRWQRLAERGETVDVAAEMMHLTLDIVSKTLFSTALSEEEVDTVAAVMTPLLRYTSERIASPFDFLEKLPTPANRRQQERLAKLDEIVYRIIATRRQSQEQADDLLGLLMAAQDEETGRRMDDQQLRDEVMTIFLAGHETTANLLAFTWALLSQHVSVRERLQEEVDQALQGRKPTAADVPHLDYTTMVLEETLRLYPPAWILSREPLAEDEIGGYPIPAGSTLLIGIYNIHRHPAFWHNPEGFDPQRFTKEAKKERERYAFIPFGGGPRLCIGNNFAMMEAALVVTMISQRFELNLAPGQAVETEVAFTLRPKDEVQMTLQQRNGQ